MATQAWWGANVVKYKGTSDSGGVLLEKTAVASDSAQRRSRVGSACLAG